MDESDRFLANVIVLEEEAAKHYTRLAQVALDAGDDELEAFFQSLTETSRLDAQEARADGVMRSDATLSVPPIGDCLLTMPKSAVRAGTARMLGVHCAMSCALSLVRRSHAYYAGVAAAAPDATLRQMAASFERERAAHIAAMESWVVRLTH